jgi:hypothetical protein
VAGFVATIRGIAGPPDPRQELTGGEGFVVGYLFSGFFSLVGLTVIGLVFTLGRASVGLLIQKELNKRHLDGLRKWLALVLSLVAVAMWLWAGFLFIWVPLVAILTSLFLWPPGYEDSSFNANTAWPEEGIGDPEISDQGRQDAMVRERTRRIGNP